MRMIFRYLSTICVLLKYEILYIQLFFVFLPAGFAHGLPYAGYPVTYAPALIAELSHYSYSYAVADDYLGAAFNHAESNDGTGVVEGFYSVNLPDGRVQHVNYHANDYDGYVADVTYDSVAAYVDTVAHPVAHMATHLVAVTDA